MDKVIIIGTYGNGSVIGATIEDMKGYWISGYLIDASKTPYINGAPVLGKVKDYVKYKEHYFIYALTSVKGEQVQYKMLMDMLDNGVRLITIIHPSATLLKPNCIGTGVIIMPGVVFSPNTVIGDFCQFYANSFVGHNSTLGDFVFVSNNASIGSHVEIGLGAHIGSNCTIKEYVKIGKWAIIGAGAVVTKDVEPYSIVVGNPARKIGEVDKYE